MKNYYCLLFAILCSCDSSNSNKGFSHKNSTYSETCFRQISEQKEHLNSTNFIEISEPTAITFFDNYDLILKYDNDKKNDSLPIKLKNDNRQTIYKVVDQYGYYQTFVYPLLTKNKIKIIKAIKNDFLFFKVNGVVFSFKIEEISEKDGVFFIFPTKKPIYWEIESSLIEYFNIQK
jgi:hypothetical protein